MPGITLSICVPTYNRADFLDHLLTRAARTWNFDFSYEIVIADNASTDQTSEIVQKHIADGLPVRYFRQPFNKGSVANVSTGFHRASGEFVLYLADDDLLIPEGIKTAIAYLQSKPAIRALYAPWELYDDINHRSAGAFYAIDRDVVFEPGQEGDLFAFLVRHHIFPEIVIYRADAVRKLVFENMFCFWAFTFLAIMVADGPVAFIKTPFYRSVTLTPVRPNRSQAGFDQAMTSWDSYRGGLEYFIYTVLLRGKIVPSEEKKRVIADMITDFVAARMRVALRLWLERRDYARAYELVCRLYYLRPAGAAEIGDLPRLRIMAFGHTLAHIANSIAEISTLLIVGAGDPGAFTGLLRDLGLSSDIEVTVTEPDGAARKDTVLVLLAHEDHRQDFLNRGYQKGLILSEADVMTSVQLPV